MVSMGPKTLLACFLLAAFALSGCAGGASPEERQAQELAEDAPEIEVTDSTGGIRGVVVDDAIRPIKGATVEVMSTDKVVTTSETGLFVFSGLEAGPYFVKASHPLYDVQQQSVEVIAGVADPEPVKILLTRVVEQDPYLQTIKYDGFIVCSANVDNVGYSEECGEGVGVPGVGRIGGQDNNYVQHDFTVGVGTKTIIVEQVWEPTSDAGRAFYTPVSTDWVCDPFCGGNRLVEMDGESPLRGVIDNETLESNEIVPDETIISTFTWASLSSNPAGVVLNQPFTNFVTTFHFVPAPEGWSFVNGDPSPF